MLPRANRLRDSKEFRRVSRSGRKYRTNFFVVSATPNTSEVTRFGFSVPKRVGNAVTRNLVKRRLRSICLEILPSATFMDVVIRAEKPILGMNFEQLKDELQKALETLEGKMR